MDCTKPTYLANDNVLLFRFTCKVVSADIMLYYYYYHWRFGVVVVRWFRSTRLTYAEPG